MNRDRTSQALILAAFGLGAFYLASMARLNDAAPPELKGSISGAYYLAWGPGMSMVQTVWDEIPAYYPGIDIDEFIIMPNHIHGIVSIVGAAPRGRPFPVGPAPCGRPISPTPPYPLSYIAMQTLPPPHDATTNSPRSVSIS